MEEKQEEYDSLCKKMDLLNREIDRKSRYIFTLEKIETLDTAAIEICELIQEKVSNLDIYGGTKIDIDVNQCIIKRNKCNRELSKSVIFVRKTRQRKPLTGE